MNKTFRLLTTIGFVTFTVLLGATFTNRAYAQATGNGIRISPVRTDLTINPGESKTLSVSVQNVTKTDSDFQALINDFVANDESGQPALILDANKYAPSHSLKRYITPITNITLKAGEEKTIKVNITIPKDAAGGGYYGAVRFAPASSQNSKNVTLSASVGSIILVRVPGDIKDDMVISSFDVRRSENGVGGSAFFTTNKDLYTAVRFQNRGNVHEQPFGKISVKQGSKVLETIEINNVDPKGNVLPDSVRRFNIKMNKVPAFGKITVEGNFGYGTNGQLLTATTSFWVVPLVLIVAVIVAIVLIIALVFGLPRAIKRYNKNVLRKAGRR